MDILKQAYNEYLEYLKNNKQISFLEFAYNHPNKSLAGDIEIVDKEDNVIGIKNFIDARYFKDTIRGSAVITFKDNLYKEILVTKRSKYQIFDPLKLCFPSGSLNLNENYLEGAKREYFEELYCGKIKDLEFEFLFKIRNHLVVYRTIDNGPFSIDKEEVDSIEFVDINKLFKELDNPNNNLTMVTRLYLEEYKKFVK
ncbi:MAG: NUDIX hydrolase [archaeon]